MEYKITNQNMDRETRRCRTYWTEFDDGYDLDIERWLEETSLTTTYMIYGIAQRSWGETCIAVVRFKNPMPVKSYSKLLPVGKGSISFYSLFASEIQYRINAVKNTQWFKEHGVPPFDRVNAGKAYRERWRLWREACDRLDYEYLQDKDPVLTSNNVALMERLLDAARRKLAMARPPDYYLVNGNKVDSVDELKPGQIYIECREMDGRSYEQTRFKLKKLKF